jgi:hypothetical protein
MIMRLLDRRLDKPSPKRVPAAERERMLDLYRGTYRGWNVKHFHEHLRRRSLLAPRSSPENLPRLRKMSNMG